MPDSMDAQVKEALNRVQKALDDIQWTNIYQLKNRNPLPHFALQATRSKINKAISAIDHLKATLKNLPQ
jgi:ribosomal protein S12 methylthiotransferase accessory factor YcaO